MSNFLKLIQEATPDQRNEKSSGGFFKKLAKGIESIERIGTGKWYSKGDNKVKPTLSKPSQSKVNLGSNILKNIKPGDTVALTLSADTDNVARIVKIIKVLQDRLVVNDTRKRNSSNYTILTKNIDDINYFTPKK